MKPDRAIVEKLRRVGLRPTLQRVALGDLLFGNEDRHVTAELLHDEAVKARVPVSLATVYNTLHHFTAAGLLRKVPIDGSSAFFDTNTSRHHHYYAEHDGSLIDLPDEAVRVVRHPEAPEGMEIVSVDVVVRIRKT